MMNLRGRVIKSMMLYTVSALLFCSTTTVVHGAGEPKVKMKGRGSRGTGPLDNQVQGGAARRLILRDPSVNLQAKPLRAGVNQTRNFARNSEDQLKDFLDTFGSGYRTRFPPEPNGYLHIGHAKAMLFNFGQAAIARSQGNQAETILRFDDTNPAAEEQEYIDGIFDSVKWLGHVPVKVTYTSDYFQQVETSTDVCCAEDAFKNFEEMRKCRSANREARLKNLTVPAEALSPWRDTEVKINLEKFEKMRAGDYKEGEAVLRMKGNFDCDNPAMWDPVLYRIKFDPPHPRTGSDWCIYPSYDMSHCIGSALQLQSKFRLTILAFVLQAADGPYYWLLHVLGMYKPVTFEYSRCSMANNVLSKRKLQRLVHSGLVDGWDDPRLLTLSGLRRRGYPPEVVNRFCEQESQQLGVSVSQNVVTQPHMLEAIAREHFDLVAPRVFAVLRPLQVFIKNFMETARTVEEASCRLEGSSCYYFHQWFPKNASLGGREISMSDCIFIDSNDFQEEPAADFFGLTVGRSVGLIGSPFIFTCEEVVKDDTNQVCRLSGRVDLRQGQPKPKGHLHWLDGREEAAARVLVRSFGPLLLQDESNLGSPALLEEGDEGQAGGDDWLKSFNDQSVVEFPRAMVERGTDKIEGPMQFVREGYFIRDGRRGNETYHQIVGLKSSKGS
ncbi:hypothetical protein GUITHDRAFT_144305 [Guillardia theta CCMP2712]|uniref:glutamine--tRNA ligase n=1 Tax=Guillardia theta (strain CCMP2712) TaxID=905079 RepID=L1IQ21_GUITC|nr:hypothetical protein GUITHDRAFT_144305 [Guillardia theta CCMP2712]EKX38376.1 hypothetical protein GUITHDRAFT_144305 [Guillardia theta CCMP2712]|eukprot:XP_005825356.1 hypothetical protein GUITHDRAFT_144305 [Guillardia theta CCMP2712]